ncbi:MAG: hypothetical protein C4519_25310 [Desulfobacteraceae bacterium]|nr:MAG: hypothetical protein C4519_25310 [Desulfobacteraceae bacterium]
MRPNAGRHLNRDELLGAVVDLQDLAGARQAHLHTCPNCRQSYHQLLGTLEQIGRTARNLAPQPARPFRLPERRTSSRRLFRKSLWAAAFAAAMLLAIVLWHPQGRIDSNPPQMTAALLARDRQLVQSVDALVEDALPANYQRLAFVDVPFGSDDTESDDFLDWIVPPVQYERTNESLI